MPPTNIIEVLNKKYNGLTKSNKKIANFIYGNFLEAQYMSITSLAEQCGVAEATISRFCRHLGLGGYNELKISLAKAMAQAESTGIGAGFALYGQVDPADSFSNMCKKLYQIEVNALGKTLALLDEKDILCAAELLSGAERVYCLGQGASLIIAMEAWGRFLSVSSRFYCVQDSHMQAMTASLLGEEDVILFFSYSGATKDILDVLRPAKHSRAKVILVTHFEKSPAAAYADVILPFGCNEGPLQQGSVAAKVAQMLVIDVLFNQFWRINSQDCIQNNDKTSAAIANKLL